MVNIQYYSDNLFMNINMVIGAILFTFLSFLFITYLISLFKKEKNDFIKKKEPLSILIPAYNEEKNIISCLKSILNSDYDLNKFQIIVIDDKSKDETKKLVKEFIFKNQKVDIQLIEGKHQGKSKSLNLGLSYAKNELILSIDADIILKKDTISKLVAPMVYKSVAATNAVARIRNPKKFIEYFQMIEFTLNNLIRTSFSKVFKNSIWFFGAVACYKKSVLNEVGNFKTDTLTEDMDICLEIYNKKYQIVTVPDAIMATNAMSSIRDLFKQRMRWYYGALQSLFKNKELLKRNKVSPPVLFLFVNQIWWTIFSFLFFPMTIYQVYYWWPEGTIEIISYLFRWFSLSGPFYVLYKIPDWGINFLNVFGVSSGIITFIMLIAAITKFKAKINFKTLICLFFYFPYTIIQDAIIVAGVIKYSFSKKKYFID
jgi:peptidoglycan-N-acetylglucosamine deacetylase